MDFIPLSYQWSLEELNMEKNLPGPVTYSRSRDEEWSVKPHVGISKRSPGPLLSCPDRSSAAGIFSWILIFPVGLRTVFGGCNDLGTRKLVVEFTGRRLAGWLAEPQYSSSTISKIWATFNSVLWSRSFPNPDRGKEYIPTRTIVVWPRSVTRISFNHTPRSHEIRNYRIPTRQRNRFGICRWWFSLRHVLCF